MNVIQILSVSNGDTALPDFHLESYPDWLQKAFSEMRIKAYGNSLPGNAFLKIDEPDIDPVDYSTLSQDKLHYHLKYDFKVAQVGDFLVNLENNKIGVLKEWWFKDPCQTADAICHLNRLDVIPEEYFKSKYSY